MDNRIKVMLGMSLFKANCEDASRTALAFSKVLRKDAHVALGVETGGMGRDSLEMSRFINDRLLETWSEKRVYVWDAYSDKKFFDRWRSNQPMPFYQGFSYGGAVNRMLVLAKLAGCEYLVRVDPGAAPPYYFREMVRHHVNVIASGNDVEVVSGQYTDRMAIRDEFLPKEKRADYYEFIQMYTGVNPYRQITGGAAFTLNVTAGPPPIPFPDFTPVWASDDGVYATVSGSKAVVLPESRIFRTEPGPAARYGEEYPVRLASMVILQMLFEGCSESDAANAGCKFLEELKSRGFYEQYNPSVAKEKLQERTPSVISGWRNYAELRRVWRDIITIVAEIAEQHCECVITELRKVI
ncbi:MAG: hypothetical protein JRE64_02880 [Deltaproteobacteria bacterium]|nr:hypothetical protein [Deltaproteobacteria bacterium]